MQRTGVTFKSLGSAVGGSTVPDRREMAPLRRVSYAGSIEPARGYFQDSATLAIAFRESREDWQGWWN